MILPKVTKGRASHRPGRLLGAFVRDDVRNMPSATLIAAPCIRGWNERSPGKARRAAKAERLLP